MKTIWFIGILCVVAAVTFLAGRSCSRENTMVDEKAGRNEEARPEESARPASCGDTLPVIRRIPDRLPLVNIHDMDSTILVNLKYATTDNFTGKILYEDIDGAYLQPDVARMLTEAHRRLKTLNPGLRLLVYDAFRPLSVQRTMWEHVKDTKFRRYVADPDRLSLHNFGAAVDLTIADSLGMPLDMGTPFDHFGRAAGIDREQELVEQGLLTVQQVQNRRLLRQVMRHAGFRSISGEWWHFNACSLQEAKQRYKHLPEN
jgi:D-alanyl-D-alanine dipeptidase